MKQRVIYYSDELNDEFSGDSITPRRIDEHYPYIRDSLGQKLLHLFWYRIVAIPLAWLGMKLCFHHKIVGREKLRALKSSGYAVYGNHTHNICDALIPTMACMPKKVSVIVHANNVSMKFLGRITPYLGALPLRDYYTMTTYYRLFISEMFPEYDKGIYIDSDTVVLGDISRLYDQELGQNPVGAAQDQVFVQMDVYGTYAEEVLGINRNQMFNAGVLLINCRAFRQEAVLAQFIDLLYMYHFVVTQDEDYLNLICKDRVLWLDQRWNTLIIGEIPYDVRQAYIVHYNMAAKPWHYADCRYQEIFWEYAAKPRCMTSCAGSLPAIPRSSGSRMPIPATAWRKPPSGRPTGRITTSS